jgi:hypothetical protein
MIQSPPNSLGGGTSYPNHNIHLHCQDGKGPEPEKGSGQERTDKTHIERARRLMTKLANFYFSQQALYKRGRDLNIKNTLT